MRLLLVALMMCAIPVTAQAEECRRFTDEYRVGGSNRNSLGVMCKEADGSWREVKSDKDKYDKGGYFIRPQDSRHYRAETPNRTHYFNDDYNTRVVIGGGAPYVVVDPFGSGYNNYGSNYSRRDWSPAKRGFHRHHRGPGWKKHWKHHQKAIGKLD